MKDASLCRLFYVSLIVPFNSRGGLCEQPQRNWVHWKFKTRGLKENTRRSKRSRRWSKRHCTFLAGGNKNCTALVVTAHCSGMKYQSVGKRKRQGSGKWTDQIYSRGKNLKHSDCIMHSFDFAFGALRNTLITLGMLLFDRVFKSHFWERCMRIMQYHLEAVYQLEVSVI
jgi:hypothetical protein